MSASTVTQPAAGSVKKLVLCFDGTGNTFSGSSGDTNIVKLYHKFNREDNDNQFHYYQTGIGTYDISGGSLNKGFFGNIASNVSRTIDSGFATSFDAHVIAGYRFIMRYYDSGDKIYMFGFSRGAFTARFLARMVNTIGILSKGNEEMVPFAYELFQKYEQGKELKGVNGPEALSEEEEGWRPKSPVKISVPDTPPLVSGDAQEDPSTLDEMQMTRNEIIAFRRTFCRRQKVERTNPQTGEEEIKHKLVKVHFLGIFDCVSSVAVLDATVGKTPKPVPVLGTAVHVRHAVAVDERRVKFKAALLNQDVNEKKNCDEDIKEVWFPGNHGDIGGGWPVVTKEINKKTNKETWSSWFNRVILAKKPSSFNSSLIANDPYQMSDIPLSWMIHELEDVEKNDPNPISWNEQKDVFERNFRIKGIMQKQSLDMQMHDTMKIGRGASMFKVFLWNFMEYLPFLPRYELEGGKWVYKLLPPNMGGTRDMPQNALLHNSLLWRIQNYKGYLPRNDHGYGTKNCLTADNMVEHSSAKDEGGNHTIYTFKNAKFPTSAPAEAPVASVPGTAPATESTRQNINTTPVSGHGQPELIVPKGLANSTAPATVTVAAV